MNTLDGPVWSKYSIALTCPARSHFQRTLNKKDKTRIRMNVAAYQVKENNEETKTGKKKAEERRPAINFDEAACCPSAAIQGQHDKKMVCARGVPRVTGTLGKVNSYFDPTQTRPGTALPR